MTATTPAVHKCRDIRKVTCGRCNRSWCERCDPCPAALCHWCNGNGKSTAPLGKPTLLASSPTLDGITKIVARFYGGSTITLEDLSDGLWEIHNRNGSIDGVSVELAKGRYRFIRNA